MNKFALIRGRFTLPRSSGLFEGVCSRGFCALVTQESRGRHRSHGVFSLGLCQCEDGCVELRTTYNSEFLFTLRTVFEIANRRSLGFVRVFDESSVSIFVVVVVILVFIFFLRLRLCLCF